jgi:hypothetical protein
MHSIPCPNNPPLNTSVMAEIVRVGSITNAETIPSTRFALREDAPCQLSLPSCVRLSQLRWESQS